jgi:hypothetical protein
MVSATISVVCIMVHILVWCLSLLAYTGGQQYATSYVFTCYFRVLTFSNKKTISSSFLPPVVLWKGSCLIYVMCVHFHMVVSYTYLLCKQHDGYHIRGRNCLLFEITWVTSGFLVDSMFFIFFSFVLFFYCIFWGERGVLSSCIFCVQCCQWLLISILD